MRHALLLAPLVFLVSCGGDESGGPPVAPSPTTTSINVVLNSPIRMGETAQASGTASLSNGQTRPVTAGWLSDAPAVATVTDAGLVTGVGNGRATIYVISGGQQGQQVVRVVPDYQGQWTGLLQVTSCTQSGEFWADVVDFCEDVPIGALSDYTLSLAQSGELMTAGLSFGSPLDFPSVAAPVGADGSSSFSVTYVDSRGLIIDASVRLNSTRIGELAGTVNEIWHAPGIAGDARVEQTITRTTRTGATSMFGARQASPFTLGQRGAFSKSELLGRVSGSR